MPTRKTKQPELKPFKFVLQAIVLETDGTGGIVGERPTNVVTVYGVEKAHAWLDEFVRTLPDLPLLDEPVPGA